jgi:photosystem II stability/assembly factor-like uncharacterized protein
VDSYRSSPTRPARRATVRGAAALALAAALGLVPRTSHANGRFPAANYLAVRPGNPDHLVLRATFGFLLTKDRGRTWDWICERAIGYSGSQDPGIGFFPGGRIAATVFEGLALSSDEGCSWTFAGGDLSQQVMVDIAVRPDDPSRAVALTGTFTGTADGGGSLFSTRVFATADEGATWAAQGTPLDPTLLAETLDYARSDAQRLYVSGVRGEGKTAKGILFVSTDAGSTWTERAVPLDATSERGPFIAAVDPTNADRVYVRTFGTDSGRLFVTDDAGKTFRVIYTGGQLLGFALSPDGSQVYVGGPKDGVRAASTSDFSFTQRSQIEVQCLLATNDALYACSSEVSGFIVGASNDQGATFTPLLHLSTIHAPLDCPGGAPGNGACNADWPALKDQLAIQDPDAGGADGGSGDGGGAPMPAKGGCDVRGPEAPSGGGVAAVAAIIAFAFALVAGARRRR